jgi:hypothetical protein
MGIIVGAMALFVVLSVLAVLKILVFATTILIQILKLTAL